MCLYVYVCVCVRARARALVDTYMHIQTDRQTCLQNPSLQFLPHSSLPPPTLLFLCRATPTRRSCTHRPRDLFSLRCRHSQTRNHRERERERESTRATQNAKAAQRLGALGGGGERRRQRRWWTAGDCSVDRYFCVTVGVAHFARVPSHECRV